MIEHNGLDMCRHSSVSVEVNAKIPDGGNRQNGSGADSEFELAAGVVGI